MPTSKEALKKKLLSQAEESLEKILSQAKVNAQMSISDMEAVVGEFGDKILPEMMAALVGESKLSEGVSCAECGGELQNKGKRGKMVITVRGEVEVQRKYYVCTACGYGFFPSRRSVGLE